MTSRPKIFSLTRQWGPKEYSQLLSLVDEESCLLLVNRGELLRAGVDVLRALRPSLVREWRARSWPGTRLLGKDTAILRKYRVDPTSYVIIREAANELWDWTEPALLEDICFLRTTTGIPWFASITHERDAYFKLNEHERSLVESAFGVSSLKLDGDDPAPDEAY